MASAPAKTILFGEHAVVYGEPSIACAIDLRTKAKISKSDKIEIKSRDVIKTDVDAILDRENMRNKSELRYILTAIDKTFEKIGKEKNFSLEIDSNIPVGVGLGSSASVVASTICALSNFLKEPLEIKEISELAYEVELEVQGAASRIDTSVVTYGGGILVKGSDVRLIDVNLPLVIGNTGIKGDTGKLVSMVRERRERNPEIIDRIIASIGNITLKALDALKNKDHNKIGELMDINHGLLDSLGVVTRELSELVHLARREGSLGAKMTGAGGGGCIIAYAPGKENNVVKAIREAGYSSFISSISKEGVRLE
ncbi:MAG: mevalonate kinase [Candidatus Hydrothermarchaeota archaeon]